MRFKINNTKFEISYLFFSVFALYLAFDATGTFLPLLLGITIHEISHLLFLRFFGCKILSVKLNLGAVSVVHSANTSKFKKIICLLAGPLSNLIVALLFKLYNMEEFYLINLIIALYNLLPLNGLDGGSILTTILEGILPENIIQKLITVLTIIIVTLFALFWIFTYEETKNVSILIFAIYLLTPLLLKKVLKDKRI